MIFVDVNSESRVIFHFTTKERKGQKWDGHFSI